MNNLAKARELSRVALFNPFSLGYNIIEDDGVRVLVDCLRVNTALTDIE